MRVDVYWNVHKKCFSIRNNGRVVAHATEVLIRDAHYVVQPAGRAKVVETGQKVVHAFVRGQLEAFKGETTRAATNALWPIWTKVDRRYAKAAAEIGLEVVYQPRSHGSFMRFGREVSESQGMVHLSKPNGKARMMDFDPCQMPEVA